MKTKLLTSLFILFIILSFISCKPTYTFIANNCPALITRKPNVKVKFKKLNQFDNDCRRNGRWIINKEDSIYMMKYNHGSIAGRVFALDENFQLIMKCRMKNDTVRGLVVSYYSQSKKWTEIVYYYKNGEKDFLRKLKRRSVYRDPCQ